MLRPFFLPTPEGELLLAVYEPPESRPYRGCVLHLPAFAEEMNKARPMVSKQARLLAAAGFRVVVPDLYGTGDSAGEFGSADWSHWLRDIGRVLDWIEANGAGRVELWGLRSGCLMALQLAGEYPARFARLLLWNPVTSGRQCVNQFLRQRMAAGLLQGKHEPTGRMREALESGASLEVAGYRIQPALVAQLDQLDMANLAPPPGVETVWLEVANDGNKPLASVSRKVLDTWEGLGASIRSRVVQGDQFWSTQEITLAPRLLEATADLLEATPDPQLSPLPGVAAPGSGAAQPLVFTCAGDELLGMLHPGRAGAELAVLLVVGGPQYRVGSHRQFVHLARALDGAGIPVLRFDYRGMGDSAGEFSGFEAIAADIRAAMDALQAALPEVKRVVIWGLCDAATAASLYAPEDQRVAGLVLLNPWVRSGAGEARTYLKHYYGRRVSSGDFWKGLVGGRVDIRLAVESFLENLSKTFRGSTPEGDSLRDEVPVSPASRRRDAGLVERVYAGLSSFSSPILLITSGRDLTAAEFIDASDAHRGFRGLLKEDRVYRRQLAESDHTFSRDSWRTQVAQWTIDWIKEL